MGMWNKKKKKDKRTKIEHPQ